METVRFHVQDSIYALLVTYLKTGSHDILNNYNTTWNGNTRNIQVDESVFKIVRRLVGEKHEVPGVNLLFYEEQRYGLRTNPPSYQRLVTIHVYNEITKNSIADERTLLKVQRKIDEALMPRGCQVVDFTTRPARDIGRNIFWGIVEQDEGWQELTDLQRENYLHRSRNFLAHYDDALIT